MYINICVYADMLYTDIVYIYIYVYIETHPSFAFSHVHLAMISEESRRCTVTMHLQRSVNAEMKTGSC